jgi:hypothetical protein
MNSRSEEYRAQAAECLELANRWRDEGKRQYEALAQQWLRLAEQAAGRPEQDDTRGNSADTRVVAFV